MNRAQYNQHQRNIRDNGLRYVLAHVSLHESYILAKLDLLAHQEDLLAWRVRWIGQGDTTRANVIRLTSPLL
jgi:hypothetical protein